MSDPSYPLIQELSVAIKRQRYSCYTVNTILVERFRYPYLEHSLRPWPNVSLGRCIGKSNILHLANLRRAAALRMRSVYIPLVAVIHVDKVPPREKQYYCRNELNNEVFLKPKVTNSMAHASAFDSQKHRGAASADARHSNIFRPHPRDQEIQIRLASKNNVGYTSPSLKRSLACMWHSAGGSRMMTGYLQTCGFA